MTTATVDILRTEYEMRRHAFELCRWINEKLDALKRSDDFDELYFERKGQNIKKLIEEAIPVSRLALQLSTPGSDVYVTCYTGNQPYDAIIEVEGFGSRLFKVEVTTTETEETTLRRQALSRQGHVAFTGPIHRVKRSIVWEGQMVEVNAEEQKCVELMFERLLAKAKSGSYDKDTAILVHLAEYRRLSMRSRADLVQRTRRYVQEEQPSIGDVYYCYTVGYFIDAVGQREA